MAGKPCGEPLIIRTYAVDNVTVGHLARTVDRLIFPNTGIADSRRELHKLDEVAPVERQFLDAPLIDEAGNLHALRLNDGRPGFNRDRFTDRADFERDIRDRRLVAGTRVESREDEQFHVNSPVGGWIAVR